MRTLTVAVLFLCLGDIVTSLYAWSIGYGEANPVVAGSLSNFLILKGVFVVGVVVIDRLPLTDIKSVKVIRLLTGLFLVGAYSFVVVSNCLTLAGVPL